MPAQQLISILCAKIIQAYKGQRGRNATQVLRLSAPQPLFSDQSRKVVIDSSPFIICLSFSSPHDVSKWETRKGTNVKAQKRQIESSVLEHWCKDCNYWPLSQFKGSCLRFAAVSDIWWSIMWARNWQEIDVRPIETKCESWQNWTLRGQTRVFFNKQQDNQMSRIFQVFLQQTARQSDVKDF